MSFIKTFLAVRRRDLNSSLQQYQRHQNKRLEAILTHAKAHVPLHHSRIQSTDPTRLHEIPPMGKDDLMRDRIQALDLTALHRMGISKDRLRAFEVSMEQPNPWIEDQIRLTRTSGTSGLPTDIFRTRKTLGIESALEIARHVLPNNPIRPYLKRGGIRIASLFYQAPWSASHQRIGRIAARFNQLIKTRSYSIFDPWEQTLQSLDDFNPHRLISYPKYLVAIAQAREQGICPHLYPEAIYSIGDLLDARAQAIIQKAFPLATIRIQYGAVESASMAFSCPQGRLHYNTDYYVMEPQSAKGYPARPGSFSDHVLITNLIRTFQPIIRYRLDDRIRWVEGGCSCGSQLPVIEIAGRRFPTFQTLDDEGNPAAIEAYHIRQALAAFQHLTSRVVQSRIDHFEFFLGSIEKVDISTTFGPVRSALKQLFMDHRCGESVTFNLLVEASTMGSDRHYKVRQFQPFVKESQNH
ncbi:MAG: hypothetical protein KTR24_18325 [Saprospiraceae bacterium]|nr:hypothetical protein [Saprospiraceae bacterium]